MSLVGEEEGSSGFFAFSLGQGYLKRNSVTALFGLILIDSWVCELLETMSCQLVERPEARLLVWL